MYSLTAPDDNSIFVMKAPYQMKEGMKILGENGGTTKITGEVYESSVIPHHYAVEVEHGTLYLLTDEVFPILTESL